MSVDNLDKYTRFALILGEDTYASPAAQSPDSARRILALLPSIAGDLQREQRHPKFLAAQLSGGRVGWLGEFSWFDSASKTFTKFFFAATATKLYAQKVGTDSDWVEVTAVGALTGFPVAVSRNNLYHLSDTVNAWIFDGANWVQDGFPIPLAIPSISTTAGSGTPALITSNRFYWTTFEDQTANRLHESSGSPRSVGSGVVNASGNVAVKQQPGTISTSSASTSVTGAGGSQFTKLRAGWKLYTSGQLQGTIASITNDTALVLTANAATTTSGVAFTSAPSRATHWVIYASEGESSNQGVLLVRLALATVSHSDTSPFPGVAGSLFNTAIQRPIRNDPALPTKVMDVHKTRIFRRRESQPNFFNYSGAEEIEVGAPEESVPGTDSATISDRVNETSYPDESDQIRALVSHGDALYIATEDETTPLFGESIDDFALSQVQSFGFGAGGRYSMISSPFGLVVGSNDRKLYLYPSQSAVASNVTTSLIELSRPKRLTFEQIKASDIDNWHVVHYNWGRRNWLVTCFQDRNSVFHTLVIDFELKAWCELATGFSSLKVFEVADGNRVLVAGGTDGFVYVVDDLTGTFAGAGNFAEGIYRTAPLDFGSPERDHVIYAVEYEKSDDSMPIEVRVYLDPATPDAPVGGIVLTMMKTKLGNNRYRGFINSSTGGACQRAMVELKVLAGSVDGLIRGLAVYAEPAARFGIK